MVYILEASLWFCQKPSGDLQETSLWHSPAMDSSGNSEQDAQPCATFNKWKYKHYFVMTEEGKKISELIVSYVLETRPCHVPATPPPTSKNI